MNKIVLDKVYVGSSNVDKLYLGNELLYSAIENGIYILGRSGKLYKRTEWTNSDFAIGVAVVTNNSRFVIARTQTSSMGIMPWNRNSVNLLINGVTTASTEAEAVNDFTGMLNTANIADYYGEYTDYSAGWSKNYTFGNGQKGYLGSVGEWIEAYNSKAEVDACMSLINGTVIDIYYYFATSTQCDSNKTWVIDWRNGQLSKFNKSDNSNVRAFSKLP